MIPVYPPRDSLQRKETTSEMNLGEGLIWVEGLAPNAQPQVQNTLEGVIAKKPPGHLLQISNIPKEVRDIAPSIRNGTLVII